MKSFSVSEAIKFGWNTTKANFSFFVKIILIVGLVYLVSGAISESVKDSDRVTSTAFGAVSWIIQMIVGIGLTKIAIKFADGQKAEIADLYNHYPLFFKYLAGSILNGIIMFVGMIPLIIYIILIYRATTSPDMPLPPSAILPVLILIMIIPMLIFGIRLQFYSYFIIDQELGPIEALKKSWSVTKDSYWNLVLLSLATGGLNLLGALSLLIGLLWTIPTTSIATASVYRKLSKTS